MSQGAPPFRVLLTGPIHESGLAVLRPLAEIAMAPSGRECDLIDAIVEADALIVRANGEVSRRVFAAGKRLKVVGRHGVGVDNIELAAASEFGVHVVNTPHANEIAVAEHAFAFLLALFKRLKDGDAATRAGDWTFREGFPGRELAGCTLGIVGFGRIGTRLARLALAFGMRVQYTDPRRDLEAERELGIEAVVLEQLLRSSDAVTLHLPLLPSTRHLMDAAALALMKPDAVLINTARGALINERALVQALDRHHLAGVALDVFEEEPTPLDSPLVRHPRVLTSPHSAAMTDASARRMAAVAEDVRRVLLGDAPRFPVFLSGDGGNGAR